MGYLPSKVEIPAAVPQKRTSKPFVQVHQTTQGFLKPRPIFCREYIPGRDTKVTLNSTVRANPMTVPVFGRCHSYSRAFFVPFRAVMHDFNSFYTGTFFNYPNFTTEVPSHVPLIPNNVFINVFLNGNLLEEVNSFNESDIRISDPANNTSKYYRFTYKGIDYITILESLGYKINWNTDDDSTASALALYCYAKVMIDWYYPSAYVGDSQYNFVQSIFNTPSCDIVISNWSDVFALLEVSNRCVYNPDYFVNLWDNPTGPNNMTIVPNVSIPDVTNNASRSIQVVDNNAQRQFSGSPTAVGNKPDNGTPFVGSNDGSNASGANGVLTQYVLDALKSLTDWTVRHRLSGVRVLDRYLSTLGINLSAEIMNRSMYLGCDDNQIEFYDVYSHADTKSQGGSPLGAFGGKGNAFGSKEFSFENGQEFGMFIIVNSIIPEIGYYQGQSKETLHKSRLEFYQPDFDHMAVQAVSSREVYVSQDGAVGVSSAVANNPAFNLNLHIFGFAPKYIEYNIPQDCQSGLYRVKSRSKLLPCYSQMRDLSYFEKNPLSQMVHNAGFVLGNDSDQYNRFFFLENDGVNEDMFNCYHVFEVQNTDCTLPAYKTYEFKHEGDQFEGKTIVLDINGSKLN